jgi:tetratricopeptide (TPR) repeat protein
MSKHLFVKILILFIIYNLQLSIVDCAYAQVDYKQQYLMSKKLFTDGKYNLAMEGFKKLVPYDQNNPFSEYASFYYAVSAYHQGFFAVSKDMFNQIKSLYPTWGSVG